MAKNVRKHTNTYGKRGVMGTCDLGANGIMELVEEFDDEPEVYAHGPRAEAEPYAQGGLFNGNGRVAKAGVSAKATTGAVGVKASIFRAYAEGPSAGIGAEAAHLPGTPLASAGAAAEASLCKAGVKVGPAVAEFNPNLNTGASISTTHVEANFLGFGVALGSKTHIATPFGKLGFKF